MRPNLITHRSLTLLPIPASSIRKAGIVWLGGKTMGQWYRAQAEPPDAMLNGSLWDKKGAIGTIIRQGQQLRSEGNGLGFGLLDSGGLMNVQVSNNRIATYQLAMDVHNSSNMTENLGVVMARAVLVKK